MNWLSPKHNAVLSIDISTAAVKLLELSRQGSSGYRVESYAVAPLPKDAVIDKNITNTNLIAESIKLALKYSGSKLKQATVAVSDSMVMTKIITLDASLNDDEMEERIMIEADQYVPYPLNEVNFDFEVQKVNDANPALVDVLLAASRKENIDHRVEALAKAGLKAEIVDVESFAMEHAFSLIADQYTDALTNHTVAIVDVGASMTTLHVLYQGRTIYTREQGFGGKQLTEEIQRRYGLSYEEAGLAKRHGGLPDNYVVDVLEPFKRAMVQQVQRALQFFVSSNIDRKVDSVILAGGCASIEGVDQLVEKSLGIPAYIANPFASMSLSSKVKKLSINNDAPALMIACGLALRGIN
jgi:type IV pilus assembly protein PilM